MDKLTPEQRILEVQIIIEKYDGETDSYGLACDLIDYFNANTTEDESLWLSEAGFCGTCAFFHREPRCPGGICGRFESKPQVEIVFGCEEYETDKDYENYWLNKED